MLRPSASQRETSVQLIGLHPWVSRGQILTNDNAYHVQPHLPFVAGLQDGGVMRDCDLDGKLYRLIEEDSSFHATVDGL